MKFKFEWKSIIYFVFGLVLGLCLMIPINNKSEAKPDLDKISYQEYKEMLDSNEKNVIFIGRDSCGWCKKYAPIIKEVIKERNIYIYYLDTDSLSKDDLSKFYDSNSLFKSDEFGTPTLAVIGKGKINNYNIGYLEKDKTIDWLKEVGVLNE